MILGFTCSNYDPTIAPYSYITASDLYNSSKQAAHYHILDI
jgi:hypothetical protein